MSVGESAMPSLSHLFSSIKVGPFRLKNRLGVSPHGPMYAEDGILTTRYVDYEIEKIEGGAGLVIMSFGLSVPDAESDNGVIPGLIATWKEENIPKFQEIMKSAREHDCRVFFQYGDFGWRIGRSPSAVPYTGQNAGAAREMTTAEIADLIAHYAHCAKILVAGGLDGIELHGHGDLFSDFLSPAINQRTDRYGGSRENRTRFLVEAMTAVRNVIGRGMALGTRLSVEDYLPGSMDMTEGVEIARDLSRTGLIDYLNIDVGIETQNLADIIPPMYVRSGYQLHAPRAVKTAVTNIPVFGVGRITDPVHANAAIADGSADLITMARALIADPELPRKAMEGRLHDIRPCLGDNQECIGRVSRHLPLACTVNPTVGTSLMRTSVRRAEKRRDIVVIGAGPAGLEAARTAALRGHRVRIFERGSEPGGNVLVASRVPGRQDLRRVVSWQAEQIRQMGVEISLGAELTAREIVALGADTVVVATGAKRIGNGRNGIDFGFVAGATQENVLTPEDVLAGATVPAGNCIVYDLVGWVEAPGIAELLAAQGRHVEIVTPLPRMGRADLDLTLQRRYIEQRLAAHPIKVTTETFVMRIARTTVELQTHVTRAPSTRENIAALIIVGHREPDAQLANQLEASNSAKILRIGDCLRAADIGHAIATGYSVGSLE